MEEFSRFGDSTEAIRAIKILKEQLQEANKNLSMWMIEFDVEVDTTTHDIRVRAVKPYGGNGVIKTISFETVLYFKDDVQGLTQLIVEEIFDVLLREQMYNQLHGALSRAVWNSVRANSLSRNGV